MTAKFFVDTNVLVYAYDSAQLDKQARAIEVIDHLARTASGAISTQVLSEFFVTVVHKRPVWAAAKRDSITTVRAGISTLDRQSKA